MEQVDIGAAAELPHAEIASEEVVAGLELLLSALVTELAAVVEKPGELDAAAFEKGFVAAGTQQIVDENVERWVGLLEAQHSFLQTAVEDTWVFAVQG